MAALFWAVELKLGSRIVYRLKRRRMKNKEREREKERFFVLKKDWKGKIIIIQ
jgi:hypothetical protein